MNRSVSLTKNDISISRKIQNHTMIDIANIIFGIDNELFYIEDDIKKIIDISGMPNYIKEDWIINNKKELDIKTVEEHIRYAIGYPSDMDSPSTFSDDDIINILKSIRRDLLIKKIL